MPLVVDALRRVHAPSHWFGRYSLAVGIVAGASLLRVLVDPLIHEQIPYFIYVASVVVATWFCGTRAGVFAAVLSAFVGNYLFVAPRYELIPHAEDWVAMGLFFAVAMGLVWLVGRWKRAERVLQSQAQDLRAQAGELRAQADALGALHAEAERVNRVKDEFLATLSHELRTPLSAIVGWARMLDAGNLDAAQRRQATQTILRNADAQLRMIEDLLDVSRIISGKLHLRLATVDFAQVVESAIELVRPAAHAKGITIRRTMAGKPMLQGDADRLAQIAWNLLSNAVKFTPKGGRVDVRVERKESLIQLVVSDTGVGIDPAFVPHLFDRFTQADSSMTRRFGGLGLGLAVVRHMVELHGGSVTAESAGRDQGATFRVSLPVHAVAAPDARDETMPAHRHVPSVAGGSPLILRGVRVLVVDDEPDARDLVQAVLVQFGAEVRAAASAGEAFGEVRNWRPDVLVADIGMPVEDGYSLLRRIRALSAAEGGSIPAAALTAYAQREDRERAFAAGFQEHVAKPVPPRELALVVASLAGRDVSGRQN